MTHRKVFQIIIAMYNHLLITYGWWKITRFQTSSQDHKLSPGPSTSGESSTFGTAQIHLDQIFRVKLAWSQIEIRISLKWENVRFSEIENEGVRDVNSGYNLSRRFIFPVSKIEFWMSIFKLRVLNYLRGWYFVIQIYIFSY